MSVIAKMKLDGVLQFGAGAISKLSCVCENDLMAAYSKAHEDRSFTKYSPWGEMKLGHSLRSYKDGHPFYVVALKGERPKAEGAAHVHQARVEVVMDFGSSKQVRLKADSQGIHATAPIDAPVVGELEWRMTIDNPPAAAFFEAGQAGYWVAFYDAEKFGIDEALADAHA